MSRPSSLARKLFMLLRRHASIDIVRTRLKRRYQSVTAISVQFVNFSDEGHVSRRYSPPWNKMLGTRYGWMETTAEHSATQMVPPGHRKCCYEWNRSGCVNSEHADQNMWILPQQVCFLPWMQPASTVRSHARAACETRCSSLLCA